jgi:hypothetical protein
LDDKTHACTHRLQFSREIFPGVNNEWEDLFDIAHIQGLNLLAVQPGRMEAGLFYEHFSRHRCLQKQLLNPYYIHNIGLLFVNFSVLNRNQICKFWCLQTIKIMQIEILDVVVLMPPKRSLEMIAMSFVGMLHMVWHKSRLTHGCIPEDWCCQSPQCGYGNALIILLQSRYLPVTGDTGSKPTQPGLMWIDYLIMTKYLRTKGETSSRPALGQPRPFIIYIYIYITA